jgi:hypothetical protein
MIQTIQSNQIELLRIIRICPTNTLLTQSEGRQTTFNGPGEFRTKTTSSVFGIIFSWHVRRSDEGVGVWIGDCDWDVI